MSDRLFVSTRKGLFTFERSNGTGWKMGKVSFLGDNVSLSLPTGGTIYAALGLGLGGGEAFGLEESDRCHGGIPQAVSTGRAVALRTALAAALNGSRPTRRRVFTNASPFSRSAR